MPCYGWAQVNKKFIFWLKINWLAGNEDNFSRPFFCIIIFLSVSAFSPLSPLLAQ